MSNVNIRRAIDNIRGTTTIYSPLVEVIVNAIEAVDAARGATRRVDILAHRSAQLELEADALPDIVGFDVVDSGIGFTQEHRDSFDTLYTEMKAAQGGKGFGRLTCLKYFANVHVDSVFREGDTFKRRQFHMGRETELILNETVTATDARTTGTRVSLLPLRPGKSFEKRLVTVARNIVERLLPYFASNNYVAPTVTLSEADGTEPIRLNEYFSNELSSVVQEIPTDAAAFVLGPPESPQEFTVRLFRLYFTGSQKSKISLVAHRREVTGTPLYRYVPEFSDDFYDRDNEGKAVHDRNYIIKAYVFGSYLDDNVSLERTGFDFSANGELLLRVSQADIEAQAAALARSAASSEVTLRQEKKLEQVQAYVDEHAPWHKSMLAKIDLTALPYNPSEEDIESRLQSEKHAQEQKIKRDVMHVMAASSLDTVHDSVLDIVSRISDTSKNDLVHYVALRRNILDLFGRSLETNKDGKYSSEGLVHDIIFPRKGNTEVTSFEDHNLWLVDERLNFTNWVSSDTPLDGTGSERPDLLVYDKRILFRGDNEPTNPVTIFEFKRPQRDDFANPSSQEDPVQQIIRYVNNIRDGRYKTPQGRQMRVEENTPFYGYVVCDITPKVERWLLREKNFKPMPDRLGWFAPIENINLYVEVLSWDKVRNDARMRNSVFFRKLGI